jgi:periplasmic divalent cation tolerance protein
MKKYVQVMTSFELKEQAQQLAEIIIQKKLAACCQIEEVTSIYRWQEEIKSGLEFRLSIKTKESLYNELEQLILDNHLYQLPEIVVTPILTGYAAYLNWLEQETK